MVKYKYGILDKARGTLIKNTETNKPILFEYAQQCLTYINKMYNNSLNLTILLYAELNEDNLKPQNDPIQKLKESMLRWLNLK